MAALLRLSTVFLLVLGVVAGAGLATGLLLHALLPALPLGHAVVAGVLAAAAAAHLVVELIALVQPPEEGAPDVVVVPRELLPRPPKRRRG